MEWCWDGENCLKFHQWNDVAIAHFASENLRSLRKSKMCHVCHVQKRESWLSATCWRSFDLQLLFFLHLASGCNLGCACRECLAKNEVSPALYKEHQKLAATHCNSDFPYARNETTFAPKMKYSQLAARWPRSPLHILLPGVQRWRPSMGSCCGQNAQETSMKEVSDFVGILTVYWVYCIYIENTSCRQFQLAFAAFAFFSVFALPGRLPGQLASHRWSDVGMGTNAWSFINGMMLQLHILLPKICDLSENLKCAMYAMCKSVKVGFPQPVEDRLTFSFSSFFTSQADAILDAHAGNVLRKMKCPLHYTKNIRNLLQLTATLISPMPAMKPRSHQKWNTLNSQHGGLDHPCIFFCLVSSVDGPLWVHVVDKMPKKHPYIENTSCRHYTSYQEIDGSTTFIVPSLQALKSALKQSGHVITGHQMSTNTCQRNPHSPN